MKKTQLKIIKKIELDIDKIYITGENDNWDKIQDYFLTECYRYTELREIKFKEIYQEMYNYKYKRTMELIELIRKERNNKKGGE